MQPFTLLLNRRTVDAPVKRIAITAAQTVAASLAAFSEGELKIPSLGGSITYQFSFGDHEPASDERRAMYQNWLLCKGLQDLARGVHESREAAFIYTTVVSKAPNLTTVGKLNSGIEKARSRAQKLNFPDLLNSVTQQLVAPLQFDAELRSLQAVRNCLEHGGGIVRKRDMNDGTHLTLRFTRRRLFYKLVSGEEVECVLGQFPENPERLVNAPIMLGAMQETRSFDLGSPVTLTVSDFGEIVISCAAFGDDLVAKLPVLNPMAPL